MSNKERAKENESAMLVATNSYSNFGNQSDFDNSVMGFIGQANSSTINVSYNFYLPRDVL